MKSLIFGLIIGVLIASAAPLSRERIAQWRSVSFVAELPAPYGDSRITITRTGAELDSRIKSMSITLKGQEVIIPESYYSDLPMPQIQTVQLTSEIGGGREHDGIYIKFQYGERALSGKGDFPMASIILWDGKISKRSITKQTSRSSWEHGSTP